MYINKALIFGNLTRDPEARRLPNGTSVTNFSVATNRVWKDKNGAKQEDTQYHNVVCFAKLAELAAQYLHRGAHADEELGRAGWAEKVPHRDHCRHHAVWPAPGGRHERRKRCCPSWRNGEKCASCRGDRAG